MTSHFELRAAEPADEAGIRSLLASAGLPSSDIALARQDFVLALQGGVLVGCAGLEVYGDAGLLRSYAVVPERRNGGLGAALHARVLALAASRGVRTAYLLTTTAERFFARAGFERIERAEVPAAVAASPEFRTLCPATAVCMRRLLGDHPPPTSSRSLR